MLHQDRARPGQCSGWARGSHGCALGPRPLDHQYRSAHSNKCPIAIALSPRWTSRQHRFISSPRRPRCRQPTKGTRAADASPWWQGSWPLSPPGLVPRWSRRETSPSSTASPNVRTCCSVRRRARACPSRQKAIRQLAGRGAGAGHSHLRLPTRLPSRSPSASCGPPGPRPRGCSQARGAAARPPTSFSAVMASTYW